MFGLEITIGEGRGCNGSMSPPLLPLFLPLAHQYQW